MQVLAAFVLVVVMIVGFSLLFAVPVWLLWNGCLVGAVAGVSEITLLQALGLSLLFSMLFKSSSSK